MDPEIEDDDEVETSPAEGETSQTEGEAEGEGSGTEVEASGDAPGGDGDDDGAFSVSFGDDTPAEDDETKAAPPWVQKLRKEQTRLARENRELKAKLEAKAAPAAIVIGEKPTLESCGYDEVKFENELDAWKDRKRSAEAQERTAIEAREKAAKDFNARLSAYGTAKEALKAKAPDFDDAEAAVLADFDVTQQNVLVHAKQPELMVYALGLNAKERARLAAIKNYAEFALEVGELVAKMKVKQGNRPPTPERRISGGAPGKGIDPKGELKRLEAEAERTGDRTKVAAYHRRQMLAGA
jgi:hypothetical protein